MIEAAVLSTLPNARFLCRTRNGDEITCHVSGHARMEIVRILPGDGVMVEPSPLDPSKGRITGKTGRQES